MKLENQVNWRNIRNNNLYYITDDGKVYSLKSSKQKELKQHPHKGYMRVWLSNHNKSSAWLVHRLVANAFISNPDNKPQVNHKDGNKQNNRLENLEWVTREEQELHKREILGWDNKGKKNPHYGYSTAKLYPSPELRNRLVELGIPRWKHNLAELGEMIKEEVKKQDSGIEISDLFFENELPTLQYNQYKDISADTEANARASMLIWLIEQGKE